MKRRRPLVRMATFSHTPVPTTVPPAVAVPKRPASARVRPLSAVPKLGAADAAAATSASSLAGRKRLERWWTLLVASFVMYNIISIPLRIGFDASATLPWYIVDGCLDLLLIVDICIQRILPFELDGLLVLDRQLIRTHYLGTWGRFDIVASIPVDLFLTWIPSIGPQPALRTNRLIRTLKMSHYFAFLERNSNLSPSMVRIIEFILLIVMFAHWVACGWFWIIRSEGSSSSGYTGLDDLLARPLYSQYVASYYWASVTITGYGGILPVSDVEAAYTLIVVVLGIAVYVTIIGIVGSLVKNLDAAASVFREKVDAINDYMSYRQIPAELQQKVRAYYTYLWKSRRGLDESAVLGDLPNYLHLDVAMFLHRDVIAKVPLFQGADPAFISAIIVNMLPVISLPGSFIIRKGEIGRELYIISKSEVEVVSEDGKQVYATLRDGQFFGEIALVTSGKRTASVRAATFCDLFVLRKEDFDEMLADFPDQAHAILEAAESRYKILKKSDEEQKKVGQHAASENPEPK